ncbi:hypothetical protein CYMTET_30372, partial [Cymbomonas tetramitiformis]
MDDYFVQTLAPLMPSCCDVGDVGDKLLSCSTKSYKAFALDSPEHCSSLFRDGELISLRTNANKWITCTKEGGLEQVETSAPSEEAFFTVQQVSASAIALQSQDEKWLRALSNGTLTLASATEPAESDHFAVGLLVDSRIAFRTLMHNLWLRAEGSSGKHRVTLSDYPEPSPMEAFTFKVKQKGLPVPPNTDEIRGVNLGGWLVMERWMKPELFKGLNKRYGGEHLYCENASGAQRRRLQDHWESFIKKEDFEWLVKHGVNSVRIPVGYWILQEHAPFLHGALAALDNAFAWAEETGMTILLDLHAAKGSQNG